MVEYDDPIFVVRRLRKRSKRPTAEDLALAVGLVARGYPQSEAAAMIGCNQGRISEALSPKPPVPDDGGEQQSFHFL